MKIGRSASPRRPSARSQRSTVAVSSGGTKLESTSHSLPQLVIDVLHFGQASTAGPENAAKMLAAVKAEDGEALLQLYTEALADFEHQHVTILNPALLERPRFMPLEAPPSGPPELDDGGNEPEELDLMQIDLIEEGSDAEPPLEAPTSSPSGVDDDGEEPEDLDFLQTGFIEEEI